MSPSRRSFAILLMGLTLAAAAGAAEVGELKPEQQRALDAQLAKLRRAKDPLLKLTPIEKILGIGPSAVEAALPDLMPLLEDPSPALRHDVVNALRPPVRLTAEQAARLERLLADPEADVREIARKTLEEIRTSRTRGTQEQALGETEKLPPRQLLAELGSEELKRRENAMQVVRKRLDDEAFRHDLAGAPATVAQLEQSPDARVRALAMQVLARCWRELPPEGAAAAIVATRDSEAPVVTAALEALARSPQSAHDDAVAAVRAQCMNENPAVQGQSLATLGALGAWDDGIAEAAIAALGSDAIEAWKGACVAIAARRQRLPAATDRLLALCSDRRADPDARVLALRALSVAVEPKRSLPALEHLVQDRTEERRARLGACTALTLIAADASLAVTTLQSVAKDERDDLDVRNAARAAADVISRH